MATVACGLYLGHKSSLFLSRGARLTGHAVWETLVFILNGFVFLLIGVSTALHPGGHPHAPSGKLLVFGFLFSGVVILLRLVWVYPGAAISYLFDGASFTIRETLPNPKSLFVIGWTGCGESLRWLRRSRYRNCSIAAPLFPSGI